MGDWLHSAAEVPVPDFAGKSGQAPAGYSRSLSRFPSPNDF